MAQQTVFVTGANKGIGLATAQQLAERGFRVWIGCRNAERGQAAARLLQDRGLDVRALVIDVTDDASVRAAADQLGQATAALDVLINNAGMHFGYPPRASEEPVEQMRTMLDVNALGPVRVTQALLPLLRKASGARIVMMSSGLASLESTADMTSENWPVRFAGYAASKAALNMFMLKLAKDLLADGIKVNAADPGLTATDLTGHMGERSTSAAAAIVVWLATLGPLGPTGGFFHDGISAPMPRHRW